MEERKTAAIVLGILALIIVFFTVILPEIKQRSDQVLSFKTCSVRFNAYYKNELNPDSYRVAQNELALCLCKLYHKQSNTSISNKIMEIYKETGTNISPDSIKSAAYRNFDSVFKYRKMAFDTLILID